MSPDIINTRMEKGQAIAQLNAVKRIDENSYTVASQSGNGEYQVIASELGWLCSCADHIYRGQKCKHIYAVEFSKVVRKAVEVRRIEPVVIADSCIFCKSVEIVKDGIRHNKHGDIQKFNCKSCKRYFTINIGFEKMKHNPQAVTTAMQLYFSGESLRNTMKSLRLIGVEVSHQTIYNWIEKYCKLMQEYVEKIVPQVSGTWRTDEIYLKVRGNIKYLYAIMDDETRFWIAQQVANTKYNQDVRPMFRQAKELAGKRPLTLISDGAPNFSVACRKEYYTMKKPKTKHIRHVRLSGDHNNNKMERLNGEIRDREKTMRGLKVEDTPILTGYQIFHNYVRGHEALDGRTPAEAAGITIEGCNKWLTLIQNASRPTGFDREMKPTET